MHKGKYQCHMAGSIGCTYHQLKYSSPNRSNKQKDKSHTKEQTFRKMEGWGKRGPKAEKNQTERATGLGRRTREGIYKSGIKLTALRFQTGGRHQKSPGTGLPSGMCPALTKGTNKVPVGSFWVLIPTESATKGLSLDVRFKHCA